MAAIKGTGVAITFQSGLFGEILDVQHSGSERAAINTSHFGTTGAHTYMPAGLREPGEYQVQIHLDPTDDLDSIMGAAAETVTVTWTDGAATTWATSGFCTGFTAAVPMEDRIVATYTIKLSGATTVT